MSIFSARDFEPRWYLVGLGHRVVRRDAPCSPRFKRVCDQDLICLKGIEADEVLSAVERHVTRRDRRVAVESK